MHFNDLGLSTTILDAIDKSTFDIPSPIQQLAIPHVLAGKDVLGIADTGSGKTGSFVLPLLDKIKDWEKPESRHVVILVLVPTRELARQIDEVFRYFLSFTQIQSKSFAVYGGVSINPQMKKLHRADILVATPGRLIELVESNAIHLGKVKTFVMDEADKLLNAGFADELNQVLKLLPAKRQNLLFSATLKEEILKLSNVVLHDPVQVEIEKLEDSIDLITQEAFLVVDEKKGPLLRSLLAGFRGKRVLIFTSSINRADKVVDKLNKNGFKAEAIHGKKSENRRMESLQQFKNQEIEILVATDLIARGIDIVELPVVINYELPRSPKDFVHRIGRTGRAGQKGTAITLVTPDEEHHFKVIQKKMKKRIETKDGNSLV